MSKWDLLAGFELVNRAGATRFRVRENLLRAGGAAVEEAVEAGFPTGTELQYLEGDWVVVLPYDDDPDTPEVVLEERRLPPAPGYEWAEREGRPILRLAVATDGTRPALHPPGDQPGWRWRPEREDGWVLVPPPGVGPATPDAPARLPAGAPDPPAPPAPPLPPPLRPPPPPVPDPPLVAAPVPPEAEAPDASPSPPRRRLGLLDYAGIVLLGAGIVLGAVLLFGGGGGAEVPDELVAIGDVLGVPPDELLAAFTEHAPGEVLTDAAPVNDPLARIEGSALVLIDLSAEEAARVAADAAGAPEPGPQLVLLLELAGDQPAAGATYRFSFLDAAGTALAPAAGGGLAPVELRRRYQFDDADGTVLTLDAGDHIVRSGAPYALRAGRYVAIGVLRSELSGTAVFGRAAAVRSGAADAYTLTPPYQFG